MEVNLDFIFGTLKSDQLKLAHHALLRKGLQHGHNLDPLDPLPNQPTTLTVRVGEDLPVNQLACYYTVDGSIPSGSRGIATNGQAISFTRTGQNWDTPAWGYSATWQAQTPGQPDNTLVHYKISAWSDDGDEVFGDCPDFEQTMERIGTLASRGEPLVDIEVIEPEGKVFTFNVDTYTVPTWAKDAVIYHIFVDRFHPGDGKDWIQTDDLREFFGGTIWGIHDKIDYIADLGVDCIWLSPTFACQAYHGYDTIDYLKTDPRMGGDEALRALIEAAHKRGIRIILDLVCNHASHKHPYFLDAQKDKNSAYRDWFFFDDSKLGYRSFFGVKSMPKINLDNPAAREWMLDNARYWLHEFDVDGYRLDYAHGVGPDFWSEFRRACREVKPDSFIFGEITSASNELRDYVGRLDGVLDFHLQDGLRKTFIWGTMTEQELEHFVDLHLAYFPADFAMPSFLDNHDMDRFLFSAGGDKDALRRAATAQFNLPHPPIIYYGTEVGLSQRAGETSGGLEESRLPMLWGDDQDSELLAFYKELIKSRR
jgi:cyclomaltodextrinase / maltogenic alpha-amylase / neopullulanase